MSQGGTMNAHAAAGDLAFRAGQALPVDSEWSPPGDQESDPGRGCQAWRTTGHG